MATWRKLQKVDKTRHDTGRFKVKQDLLYRIFTSKFELGGVKEQIVLILLRSKVIAVAHDGLLSGHNTIKRTMERVLSCFYWRDVNDNLSRFWRSCEICQTTSLKGRQRKGLPKRMPAKGEPFNRVDLISPNAHSRRYYVLSLSQLTVDVQNRWFETIELGIIATIKRAVLWNYS